MAKVVYLVIERDNESEGDDCIFGVYEDESYAIMIQNGLRQNFEEHNEKTTVAVVPLVLNKETKDYEFFMNN